MRVIITGGTGLIGQALAKDLAQDGIEVIVLSRNPEKYTGQLPAGVRLEAWDSRSAAGWGKFVDGETAIVNLAGENLSSGPWTNERKQRIRQSRLDAGRAVVQAVEQAAEKPRVVIQSSGAGYYGPRTDELITEEAGPGNDFLSQVCVEWENATAPLDSMGVRRPIMRSGVVLSPESGALPRMMLPFKLFAGGPLGSGRQWLSWIHLADQVGVIRFLVDHPTASGPVNVATPNPVRNYEFSAILGKVMRRPAFFPTPASAIRLVFGQMSMVVLEGQRISPARLQALGFQFRFLELEPALRDLIEQDKAERKERSAI